MQKTLRNSDLVIQIQFKDTFGSPTPIPMKFKLLFYRTAI